MSLASCLPLLFQLAASSAPVSRSIVPAAAVSTRPVLALPEVGLDDTAAYQGYRPDSFGMQRKILCKFTWIVGPDG